MKPRDMKKQRLEKEISSWEERVFYPDEKFKENTPADLEKLKHLIRSSKEEFVFISAETEGVVYKIGRFFIENGVSNTYITFQDGEIIEPYIDGEAKDSEMRALLERYLKIIQKEIKSKWVFIPLLNFGWSKKTALYFVNELKVRGAVGVVMYSNPDVPDNLPQVLVEETNSKIHQFPQSLYKKKIRKLKEDNY
mgnify:FL=1